MRTEAVVPTDVDGVAIFWLEHPGPCRIVSTLLDTPNDSGCWCYGSLFWGGGDADVVIELGLPCTEQEEALARALTRRHHWPHQARFEHGARQQSKHEKAPSRRSHDAGRQNRPAQQGCWRSRSAPMHGGMSRRLLLVTGQAAMTALVLGFELGLEAATQARTVTAGLLGNRQEHGACP